MPASLDTSQVEKSPVKKFNIKKLIKYTSVTDLNQNLISSRYPLAEEICNARRKQQEEISPEKRRRSKTTSSLEMSSFREEINSSKQSSTIVKKKQFLLKLKHNLQGKQVKIPNIVEINDSVCDAKNIFFRKMDMELNKNGHAKLLSILNKNSNYNLHKNYLQDFRNKLKRNGKQYLGHKLARIHGSNAMIEQESCNV